MRENWVIKTLGEVADIKHGKNQKEVEDPNGQYPIYGSGGNIMGFANDYLCDEFTTILGRKGSINNPIFIETKFWNVDTAFGISAKDNYNKKLLYYFIKSIDWSKLNSGTTIPSLTQSTIQKVPVPVPPLSEQTAIVEKLDLEFAKIDLLKNNAQKQLDEAKALFQSTLKQLLSNIKTDNIKKLDSITYIINGYAFPSDEFNPRNKNYAIKITNVGVNEFVVDESNKVSDKYNDVANIQVNTGDIVIALTRTIISSGIKVALVPPLYDNAFVNQRVAGIKAKDENVDFQFLYYYLSSDEIYKYILKHVNTLMQPNLSIKDLKNMPIPLPSLDEQKSIVEKLDAISSKIKKLEENYKNILIHCDDLKQAILREIFG